MKPINLNDQKVIHVPVDSQTKPIRIDVFLSKHFPDYSRTYFQKIIEQSLVKINGVSAKASSLVKANDMVAVEFPTAQSGYQLPDKETVSLIKQIPVEVLYEHDDFLIITKPAYLTVHKPSLTSTEITLVDWLLLHFQEIRIVGDEERPGIVHRLDKDTSGVMIIARNNRAHAYFSKLFKDRAIKKHYKALVAGNPPRHFSVDAPIGRDHFVKTKMAIHGIGNRPSLTDFVVEKYTDNYALVDVYPHTGRTHQIRVHLAHAGYPILGDVLYGKSSDYINRQALHASEISFVYKGEPFSFLSPLPKDFQQLVDRFFEDKNRSE